MNHKWRKGEFPQLCLNCGILRERRTFKTRMAIMNHPPWEAFVYETKMVYTGIDLPTTTERPDCKKLNVEQNGAESDTTEVDSSNEAGNKNRIT